MAMSGGMEVDPAAIQAFAAMLEDAKGQVEQIKVRIETPNATAEHFGREWTDVGEEYAKSWGMLGPDLASLVAVLEQVQAQLVQGAELNIAGETANIETFNQIDGSGGN